MYHHIIKHKDMSLPRITVIIPLYNVEAYIQDCLQSVVRQTYHGEMECIIVDDCGTDHSVRLVEQFIAAYTGVIRFILLHHTYNRGLSAARNTGVDAATGDYIYFLDSDDYISADCLTILADRLREREYQIVIGDYDTFGDKKMPSLLFETNDVLLGRDVIFHKLAERQLCVMAWNKLCKTSFLKEHRITFLEGQLNEDDLWSYKCYTHADSIAISHRVTYHYRIRHDSIMGAQRKGRMPLSSLFDTVKFILENKCGTNVTDYEKCALTYISKYLSYCVDSDVSFYTEYKFIRNHFPYSPIRLFVNHKIPLQQVKHKFHFVLPALMGYVYLLLRRFKIYKL